MKWEHSFDLAIHTIIHHFVSFGKAPCRDMGHDKRGTGEVRGQPLIMGGGVVQNEKKFGRRVTENENLVRSRKSAQRTPQMINGRPLMLITV